MTAIVLDASRRSPVDRCRSALNSRMEAFAAANPDVDADGRLFSRVFAALLSVAVLRLAFVATSGVPVFETTVVRDVLVGLLALAISLATSRMALREATLVLRGGAAVAITGALFSTACVDVFHAGRAFPLRDAAFEAADRAIGLDWLAYARFLDSHPALWDLTLAAYGSIFAQFTLAIFLLAFSRSASRLYAYLLAQTLSLTAVAAVALFLPAIGAYEQSGAAHAGFLHAFATADNMTSSIAWLRGEDMSAPGGVTVFTLVSFPSFHACSAVLFSWAAWRVPYVRWASLALNATMLAATPVHGSHYLVDVIAGVAIATLAILASVRIVAAMDSRAQNGTRGASAASASSAVPAR